MEWKKLSAAVAAGVVAAVAAATPAMAQGATEFTVRIENVSNAGTLKLSNGMTAPAPTSPGVWAVYRGSGNPIFKAGKYAGDGLKPQAEEGNPARLAEVLKAKSGVTASGTFTTPVGDMQAGPLLPGKAFEFRVTARPGEKLALAMMFAQSNDLFYSLGTDGLPLFDRRGRPVSGEVTDVLRLWDAGTEVNEEPGLGPNQAPRQAAPGTGVAERRPVRLVRDRYKYPPNADVVRVVITPSTIASR